MGDDNKIYITNSSDLPEVTITAPRKYFVGYDENANPIYTTDRTLSQDYLQSQIPVGNTEQKRKQWAFENVGANGQTKPGIQGDAKDISRLVTTGIGSTLAPIAVAPVARAVFPAVKTLASAGRNTWNAVKPGGTIPNWLYRQTFTPQGTLTKGATELLGSTVAGEGLNEILNQKSKSGDWTENVDHKYFHGDIGNTIGEEGRSMFLTAPLYGTYNIGKQIMNGVKNLGRRFVSPYVIAREINLAAKNKPIIEEFKPYIITKDYLSSSKQKRVVPQNTFYLYPGPKHSINEVVNPDGTVNVRNAMRIQHEVADNIPGAFRMEDRVENPKWHKNDPNTFLHTRNVAQSAWSLPIPIGYTKQDQMIAALGHDFGKMISGDGHAENGAGLLYQIFPDITTKQLTAIGQHMGQPITSLGLTTKMADFMNGKLVRKSNLTQAERLGIPKALRFVPKWHVANYPGYLLKGLMSGSPIERQLSKNGTININLLNAYFNKASQVERDVANKVLAEKFAGLKTIDYNLFKKAVLDELITYNRKPEMQYSTYGMDRLGFNVIKEPDGAGGILEYLPGIRTNTFTFESPKIPIGNSKHYNPTTLGHSRTYTTPDELNILHVMESLSDWAQQGVAKSQLNKEQYDNVVSSLKTNLKNYEDELERINYQIRNPRLSDSEVINLNDQRRILFEHRDKDAVALSKVQNTGYSNPQSQYLSLNYLQRQLQENLRYAAEKDLTKMRYPTPETAAKIEGYKPQTNYEFDSTSFDDLSTNLQKHNKQVFEENDWDLEGIRESWIRLFESHPDNEYILQHALEGRPLKYDATTLDLIGKARNSLTKTFGYKPEHQTILKKYSDFPKLFLKLYKDLKVRTVTDTKGNTWYEVDVPRGYLNREWLFKQGGKINNK